MVSCITNSNLMYFFVFKYIYPAIESKQAKFPIDKDVLKRFVCFYAHHYAIVSSFVYFAFVFFSVTPSSRMFVGCLHPFYVTGTI